MAARSLHVVLDRDALLRGLEAVAPRQVDKVLLETENGAIRLKVHGLTPVSVPAHVVSPGALTTDVGQLTAVVRGFSSVPLTLIRNS